MNPGVSLVRQIAVFIQFDAAGFDPNHPVDD